ncbi:hypothetical protein V1503_24870 [Bacillus sp. SCS-151]|uniref:hypothetical protein n=1 Tax=Nanhaiella sioensis TaxID=3115293 RepID=UPI00397E12F2
MKKHADAVDKYIKETIIDNQVEIQPFSMLHCGKRLIFEDGNEIFVYYCPVDQIVKTSQPAVVGAI